MKNIIDTIIESVVKKLDKDIEKLFEDITLENNNRIKNKKFKGLKIKIDLKYYRKSVGMTQQQVANIIGISRIAYQNIECNKSVPRLKTLILLSALFEVSIYEILDYEVII